MKYVKMLGFAAVAAAALMAFVGASTASATVLCKTTPAVQNPTGTTCPLNQAYPAGTEIHAVLVAGTHATLTSEEAFKPNITCKKSTVSGKTENEGSATETVKGKVEVLTFEECGEAEVKVLNKGSLEVHWIEGTHNGTLTGTGQEITTVVPSIFGNIHCIYRTNATHLGTVVSGKTAGLEAKSQAIPFLETSSLCPSGPKWDANYSITTPDEVYVAGHT